MGRHQHLKKGFGTVRFLGEGRYCPYAVHPPKRGGVRPPAICYVAEWPVGVAVLTAWHAGKYYKGLERELEAMLRPEKYSLRKTAQDEKRRDHRAAADGQGACLQQPYGSGGEDGLRAFCMEMSAAAGAKHFGRTEGKTLSEVFRLYAEDKFGEAAARRCAESTRTSVMSSYRHLKPFWELRLDEIGVENWQRFLNRKGLPKERGGEGLARSTVGNLMGLIGQIYDFALARHFARENPADFLKMPRTREPEHHEAFTDEELRVLWRHREDPVVRMILIMCYSGFRVSAYVQPDFVLDREAWTFCGGLKTKAGKGRVVPVHSAIRGLVSACGGVYLCGCTPQQFRRRMVRTLQELGLRPLTPHSCRHTFSRLLEHYGARETDRKRLLGHSLKGDITNDVYGHRTTEELRAEIEKIRKP